MQQGSNANATVATGTPTTSPITLTDEQILGIEPLGTTVAKGLGAQGAPGRARQASSTDKVGSAEDVFSGDDWETASVPPSSTQADDGAHRATASGDAANGNTGAEPAWLKSLEASAIPNGGEAAAEARRWRQAALDTAALDADYFSAEPGARAGLATRLHADDPAAFRSMLADAARILAERDPQGLAELARELGAGNISAKSLAHAARRPQEAQRDSSARPGGPQNDNAHDGVNASASTGTFPAEAYRSFEAATNDDVARQVRDSIERTLSATLPDGVADGARRRIGEDIFRDLSATLSTDRQLSGQISELLRGWRFDAGTRQQLAGLLAGRARTALPEVARRVVSEWTSSVLASDRARQSRIASAASRRDITGGRLPEQVASSALRPRNFDYARTSDEQILEM